MSFLLSSLCTFLFCSENALSHTDFHKWVKIATTKITVIFSTLFRKEWNNKEPNDVQRHRLKRSSKLREWFCSNTKCVLVFLVSAFGANETSQSKLCSFQLWNILRQFSQFIRSAFHFVAFYFKTMVARLSQLAGANGFPSNCFVKLGSFNCTVLIAQSHSTHIRFIYGSCSLNSVWLIFFHLESICEFRRSSDCLCKCNDIDYLRN